MTGRPDRRVLRLHWDLAAARGRVFTALTDPDDLARWWGPAGFTTQVLEHDLRVDGRYRFRMQPPEGDPFHLTGGFLEVDPPSRLAFTFRWEEPDPDDRDTAVTLRLEATGDGTQLWLEQGEFATEARLALHRDGWTESLERLRRHLDMPGRSAGT